MNSSTSYADLSGAPQLPTRAPPRPPTPAMSLCSSINSNDTMSLADIVGRCQQLYQLDLQLFSHAQLLELHKEIVTLLLHNNRCIDNNMQGAYAARSDLNTLRAHVHNILSSHNSDNCEFLDRK